VSTEAIKFWATVAKIQTLADGGVRISLDAGEDSIEQVVGLMICKRDGVVLDVECRPRDTTDRD